MLHTHIENFLEFSHNCFFFFLQFFFALFSELMYICLSIALECVQFPHYSKCQCNSNRRFVYLKLNIHTVHWKVIHIQTWMWCDAMPLQCLCTYFESDETLIKCIHKQGRIKSILVKEKRGKRITNNKKKQRKNNGPTNNVNMPWVRH